MATLDQIISPVWTYSIAGGGAVVEGLDAIGQCIDLILRTTPGSDPLRPLFGCNIMQYQDQPVNVAIPNMKKAILEAIAMWETRVVITSITDTYQDGNVIFNIGFQLADSTLAKSIAVTVGNGGVRTGVTPKGMILQGLIPPNPTNFQYQVDISLNGSDLLPTPPEGGFADMTQLAQWVQSNYGSFGQWYLTSTALVGYINPQYTSGSITISVLALTRFAGAIPGAAIGDKYLASIVVDGVTYASTGTDLFTVEDVLLWAQANIGALGVWQVEQTPGDFGGDFSFDFLVNNQDLVIYTNDAQAISITITIISA